MSFFKVSASLSSAVYLYEGVTAEEQNSIAQDVWVADLDGVHYVGTLEPVQALEGKLMSSAGQALPALYTEQELDALRQQVTAEIKAERDRRKAGGFHVGDKWFHSDGDDRSQYLTLLITALEKSLPVDFVFDQNWLTMDGTFVPMTVELIRQVRDAGIANEQILFNQGLVHIAAMLTLDNPRLYDYSGNWSETYATFV